VTSLRFKNRRFGLDVAAVLAALVAPVSGCSWVTSKSHTAITIPADAVELSAAFTDACHVDWNDGDGPTLVTALGRFVSMAEQQHLAPKVPDFDKLKGWYADLKSGPQDAKDNAAAEFSGYCNNHL
jgi:hypothetical protein